MSHPKFEGWGRAAKRREARYIYMKAKVGWWARILLFPLDAIDFLAAFAFWIVWPLTLLASVLKSNL